MAVTVQRMSLRSVLPVSLTRMPPYCLHAKIGVPILMSMTQLARFVALSVMVLVSLYGCTSFGHDEATGQVGERGVRIFDEAAFVNRISIDGYQMALPAGWSFGPTTRSGVVLAFRHGTAVVGAIEHITFPQPFSQDAFIAYFVDHVFVSDDRPRVSTAVSPVHGEVTVITGVREGRLVATAMVVSMEDAILLHLIVEPRIAFAEDDVVRLIEAYNTNTDAADHRVQPGGIGFVAVGNEWRWFADDRGGFLAAYQNADADLAIGIRPIDNEQLAVLESEMEALTSEILASAPAVPPRLSVAAVAPSLRGATAPVAAFISSHTRMHDVTLVYQRNERLYAVRISQRKHSATTLQSVLTHTAVQAFLDFYVIFPDQD